MQHENDNGDVSTLNADLAPGTVVGEYEVEGKIGEGGFGSVFRAVHPLIGKAAAIKVLNQEFSVNPEMVQRFISEARAVNQIRHRNIIDIFSFGRLEDGRCYYVMELLGGQTLDDHLAEAGRVEIPVALGILRSLGRALDAAHAQGIAHRDLKPENVFLTFDEEGKPFPKLLDFGIAKLLSDDEEKQYRTRTGAPIGTPAYMSPEQCRGRQVDHRTDIYAFGIMTFELLTGRRPFDGESFMDIMVKQMNDPAPAASSYGLPPAFDAPLASMLAKDPEARPATVDAAMTALYEAAAGSGLPVRATTQTPVPHLAAGTNPSGAFAGPSLSMGQAVTGSGVVGSDTVVSSPPPRRRPLVAALGVFALLAAGLVLWMAMADTGEPADVPVAAPRDVEPAAAERAAKETDRSAAVRAPAYADASAAADAPAASLPDAAVPPELSDEGPAVRRPPPRRQASPPPKRKPPAPKKKKPSVDDLENPF